MKVSVCIVTYNHESLLGPAIESVLAQATDFEFEILIGEDASTDGTREVLRQYAKRDDRIVPVYQEKNVGAHANHASLQDKAKGEYLAFLDGDDRWTCPTKLQQQVDLLDAHPDTPFCGHLVVHNFLNEPSREPETCPEIPVLWTLEDQVSNLGVRMIPFSSWMVRRSMMPSALPIWFADYIHGDIIYSLLMLGEAPARFIQNPMGVHNVHDGGVDSGTDLLNLNLMKIHLYEDMKSIVDESLHSIIDARKVAKLYDIALAFSEKGDHERSQSYRRAARDIVGTLSIFQRAEWKLSLLRYPALFRTLKRAKKALSVV
jgi:glycosyltransferase involved in cell wall biosynthesis